MHGIAKVCDIEVAETVADDEAKGMVLSVQLNAGASQEEARRAFGRLLFPFTQA